MAWTTPRTWVTSEVVTASLLNTHLRDNLDYLKNTKIITGSYDGNNAQSRQITTGGIIQFAFIVNYQHEYCSWFINGADSYASLGLANGTTKVGADLYTLPHASDGFVVDVRGKLDGGAAYSSNDTGSTYKYFAVNE